MKKILILLLLTISLFSLTSCIAGIFEEEITVKFMCDGEEIASGTVTQFLNMKSPALPEAYIPDNYKFYGWTALNNIKVTDPNIKEKYIGDGKMVHYMDIRDYVQNGVVQLNALMFDKDDIPVEYHYVVIAWYDKFSTSGVNQELMDKLQAALNKHLKEAGVSDEDIATIIIRGYSGNVGPSCGAIMDDGDVDIMLGWGSVSNVTSTGGMPEEMIIATNGLKVDTKNRQIHLISEKETAKLVFEWMKTAECTSIFGGE